MARGYKARQTPPGIVSYVHDEEIGLSRIANALAPRIQRRQQGFGCLMVNPLFPKPSSDRLQSIKVVAQWPIWIEAVSCDGSHRSPWSTAVYQSTLQLLGSGAEHATTGLQGNR